MKNIIITCWTSICNEFTISNPNQLTASQKLDANPSSFNDIYDSIIKLYEWCEDYQLWAEIYTLLKLEKDVDDTIYFFFSETKWWELVKKLFVESNILKERIGDYKYIYDTIDWFNVKDKNLFKEKAISNFYEKLEKIKSSWDKTIMCPVGWYKALIPYASLYAMVHGWDIKYIYEDSDELMDLPSGALGYFVYWKSVWKDIKIEDSLSKNIDYDLEKIIEISNFVSNFKNYWQLNNIDNVSFLLNNPWFPRSLKLLKDTIDFIWINNSDLKNIKSDLIWIMRQLKKSDSIEALFLKDVLDEIQDNFLDSTIDWRFTIINWYLQKGKIQECFLILRELFLDIFSIYIFWEIKNKESDISKVDYRWLLETQLYIFFSPESKDRTKRRYLEDETTLTLDEQKKIRKLYELVENYHQKWLLKESYDKAKDVRNILAHIWKQNKDFYSKLWYIKSYIDVLESFKNYILQERQNNP